MQKQCFNTNRFHLFVWMVILALTLKNCIMLRSDLNILRNTLLMKEKNNAWLPCWYRINKTIFDNTGSENDGKNSKI